jgi:hypothetical protein
MIVLIHQLIDISIIYFGFEKVLKIDIWRYYEDLTFPAITIGLTTYCDLKDGNFEPIFKIKCMPKLKKRKLD